VIGLVDIFARIALYNHNKKNRIFPDDFTPGCQICFLEHKHNQDFTKAERMFMFLELLTLTDIRGSKEKVFGLGNNRHSMLAEETAKTVC